MNDLISRQAAIRWVKTECNPYGEPTLDFESGKKVIEHLKQMPSAEAIPLRKDCAECALKAINRPKLNEESYERGYTAGQMAGRPKGLWTITTTDDGEGGEVPHLICSECGNEPMAWSVRQFFNFCPNCGADMRGEEE